MKWRLALVICCTPLPALAHDRHLRLWPIASLSAVAILFVVGLLRAHRWHPWRIMSFTLALLSLALLMLPPMAIWARDLFTFHMIEHEVLMAVAAPLIIFARAGPYLLAPLPRGLRAAIARMSASDVWNAVSNPFPATLLHGMAIWMWHVPLLFDAALRSTLLHDLQHASFFLTALLFWHAMMKAVQRRKIGSAMRDLLFTSLHTGGIGALMTLSPRLWYPAQHAAQSWGLLPLEDQQLAGLVMWTPAGFIYAAVALWLMGQLLHSRKAVI